MPTFLTVPFGVSNPLNYWIPPLPSFLFAPLRLSSQLTFLAFLLLFQFLIAQGQKLRFFQRHLGFMKPLFSKKLERLVGKSFVFAFTLEELQMVPGFMVPCPLEKNNFE
jgi:hypothetical protein